MSNASQWDVVAGNNTDTPPDGAPEGMQRSSVNDTMREMMAASARWYKDTNGSLTSAGTSSAYTLTTNAADTALADTSLLVFRAHAANTATPTLNRDSVGAKTIKAADGGDLPANAFGANEVVVLAYNATGDYFNLLSAFGVVTTEGDILYRGSGGLERLGIGTAGQVLKVNSGATAPEWAGGSGLVQVVNTQTGAVATGSTTTPLDDTVPAITDGTQFLSRAITPTSSTNNLVIEVLLMLSPSTDVNTAVHLHQDGGAALAVSAEILTASNIHALALRHFMQAGTASSTTFTVRAGGQGASTLTLNGQSGSRRYGGVASSSITISEVAA